MAVGLVVDYMLPASWFVPRLTGVAMCCRHSAGLLSVGCSVVLVGLLVYTLIVKPLTTKTKITAMTKKYRINGMACVHCKARVEAGLATVEGVTSVTVDLAKKIAIVEGAHSEADIAAKVAALGYEYVGETL
jgi:copper chaperone CopZ